jgi:hypothetical protein
MSSVVDNLGHLDLGHGEDILNIFKMPSASLIYQYQTERHEACEQGPRKEGKTIIKSEALDDENARGKSADECNSGDDVDCQYSYDCWPVARLAQIFRCYVGYVGWYSS